MDIENIALDLLDFCGGSQPDENDLQSFMLARELCIDIADQNRIVTTAIQLLEMP